MGGSINQQMFSRPPRIGLDIEARSYAVRNTYKHSQSVQLGFTHLKQLHAED